MSMHNINVGNMNRKYNIVTTGTTGYALVY